MNGRQSVVIAARIVAVVLGMASASIADGPFSSRMKPVPGTAVLIDRDFFIWGASMVQDRDGLCHLFYTRWPRRLGHSGWAAHSEIAHATSANPLGPYTHVDVALPARGKTFWDGLSTFNPNVHEFEGKYYLYYAGNTGDGRTYWTHRNNQRVGVAVADHPSGPWKRFDAPLIDVSRDPKAHDALVANNPSICRRPDGKYLMVYKAVGMKRKLPSGGPVVHLVATSDSPSGPFVKHPDRVFMVEGAAFPAEDPYIWVEKGLLWAIVKDVHGTWTKSGYSLALFRSEDGIDWKPAEHPLVSKIAIHWEGGTTEKMHHLERPQLWLKDGVPQVLFCAADRNWQHSFNVHIPLANPARMERYNVVWNSPSKDASGQMPLGNGDIAAGVYAIEDGDLYLLLAKNDAYTYSGDIFKTGRVRVSLDPNPFVKGKPFKQTLDLATGSIRIEAAGVKIRVWADANRSVYHVEIDTPGAATVTAVPEFWERIDSCGYNSLNKKGLPRMAEPLEKPTQDVRVDGDNYIAWYYAVGDRSEFPGTMKYYDVEHLIGRHPDPYRFNMFGNLIESPELELRDGTLQGRGTRFDIRIHALCKQEPKVADWIEPLEKQARAPIDLAADWAGHCAWWDAFWERSWITVTDNTVRKEDRETFSGEGYTRKRSEKDGGALVAQSYNVFRFLMACQSRGRVQAKFNGGLFTQPLRSPKIWRGMHAVVLPDGTRSLHEDEREWGRRFTFQNQRLLYWPLLMSGDFELMQPFFRYYFDMLPVRKAITKAWFGHEGAYYRENMGPDGGELDCSPNGKPMKIKPGENRGQGWYFDFYFTSGLETLAMMIDYANYSGDTGFRDEIVVPFAREVLLFFDKHYPRDPDGKLRIDPGMVLETWWIAVNAAPDVSGLQFCLDELLTMRAGTSEDRNCWKRFRAEIPDVHLREIGGRKAIAPAREWAKRRNYENGELYPVFPFRRFGLGLGTKDLVEWTMRHRANQNAFQYKCWTQDQIHWAYAGNAGEARDGLVHRFRHASDQCRFPLYGQADPDSCPDFDHFGAGSTALQRMLVQETASPSSPDGSAPARKILLLPAWPSNWDADFKLHLQQKTVIRGRVVGGKLEDWSIVPASRRKDVVVCQPQHIPLPPIIPVNRHPVRIGLDQAGSNRFKGEIGRVTMFRSAIAAERIRALAAGGRDATLNGDTVVKCLLNPGAGDVLPTQVTDLAGAVSFETWIQPGDAEAGRILDKLTGGQKDGFLLDCFPNLSLRLIVGPEQIDFDSVLKAGVWHHIAVVIDRHERDVYLDGKKL